METKKFDFFFQKSLKLNLICILTCAEELKSTFKLVSTCTYVYCMSTSGMHRCPFEGRHLVDSNFSSYKKCDNNASSAVNRSCSC